MSLQEVFPEKYCVFCQKILEDSTILCRPCRKQGPWYMVILSYIVLWPLGVLARWAVR